MICHVDLLEPDTDLNIALDNLGNELGKLYKESWDSKRKNYSDKPFNLNINGFANLWFNNTIRVFIAYNDAQEPIGFLLGMVFRPMPYNANVFQIEDWYSRGNDAVEKALFSHVMQAVKYIGCDEIWIGKGVDGATPNLGTNWKADGSFTIHRYVKDK